MEQRRSYRVVPDASVELSVHLLVDGERHDARIVDISRGGVGIRTPASGWDVIALGSRVTVVLESPKLAGRLELEACAVSRRQVSGHCRFGLAFTEPDSLNERLDGGLETLFNQRRYFRVTPRAAGPVRASIRVACREPVRTALRVPRQHLERLAQLDPELSARVQDFGAMVELVNLSVGGVGLLVTQEVEARLAGIDTIEVLLRLPDAAKPIAFVGQIRHRQLTPKGVYYGIQFDPVATSRFQQGQDVVFDYVARQQQQEELESEREAG